MAHMILNELLLNYICQKGKSMDKKKIVRFAVGAIAMEIGLIAACYLDMDGTVGNIASVITVAGFLIAIGMYYLGEIDRRRSETNRRIERQRRILRENQ